MARIRAAGEHLTFTMTFKVSLWPAGSELYIANGPLGPQIAVISQRRYQGCALGRPPDALHDWPMLTPAR